LGGQHADLGDLIFQKGEMIHVQPDEQAVVLIVFHAVGPIYRGGKSGEPELLASAYRACMELARERGVARISFPSISTGVYGYPLAEAAPLAIGTVARELTRLDNTVREAIFVLFDNTTLSAYRLALE
jgi:O-acetyl-ADP-ribose deacetylase (regulator of RNase III)